MFNILDQGYYYIATFRKEEKMELSQNSSFFQYWNITFTINKLVMELYFENMAVYIVFTNLPFVILSEVRIYNRVWQQNMRYLDGSINIKSDVWSMLYSGIVVWICNRVEARQPGGRPLSILDISVYSTIQNTTFQRNILPSEAIL